MGKGHAEEYLRNQYRRGCRPNTAGSRAESVELFLNSRGHRCQAKRSVAENGKGAKGQVVHISDDALCALGEYLKIRLVQKQESRAWLKEALTGQSRSPFVGS